ncbi:VOC family protein [Halococcus saccharolyticus]|uniref:Biphenyl-2,3-diol 1,2-dioxygenase III n=1 Tax=Halococcus saccharolyticus DSM 5350 TaxID=1227455 RepID=M0MPQ2_9EURY|nr:VOC family protein [Halococcus saccharolyticus]EMA46709.1 biphenyl-2,3-diol 1,2-dioxygenase III [Halococcus saccharolyticus DSM 5350]
MSRSTPHLGHVHLKIRDVERSVAFYTDVFDLDVNDRHGPFAFLSFGDHHHDVAVQEIGADAAGSGPGVGLYHAAFEVESREALRRIHETLDERGVRVDPIDHGISEALYFDDPDGNGLEVYRDTRVENDHTEWQGMNEPFDPMAL